MDPHFQPCFSFSNALIVSSMSAADQTNQKAACLAHLSSRDNDSSSSEQLAQDRDSITTGVPDQQATAGFSFFDRCYTQNDEPRRGTVTSISSISATLSVVSPDRKTTSRIKPSGDPCVASSPDSFISHRKHSSVSEGAIFSSGKTSIRDHTMGLKRLLGFGRRSESSSAVMSSDSDGRGKTEKDGEGETCANNKEQQQQQQQPPNNNRRRQSASGSREWHPRHSAKRPQSGTSSSCSQKPIITKPSSSSSPTADSGKDAFSLLGTFRSKRK